MHGSIKPTFLSGLSKAFVLNGVALYISMGMSTIRKRVAGFERIKL